MKKLYKKLVSIWQKLNKPKQRYWWILYQISGGIGMCQCTTNGGYPSLKKSTKEISETEGKDIFIIQITELSEKDYKSLLDI